jgi:hypothetical protein
MKLQPMATTTLNNIEILSCISVIVSAFASVFFVVEYKGQQLLQDGPRDLAGLALVITCGICALVSVRLMYHNFTGKSCSCLSFISFVSFLLLQISC